MKKFLLLIIVVMLAISFLESANKKRIVKKGVKPVMKKIVMIIAKNDFRDEEYLQPKEILTKAKVEIILASSSKGTAKGVLGANANVDVAIDQIDVKNYDAVIFIGGSGASEYFENKQAHKIARDTINGNKILGAICIAPVTLAKAGVLKNKKATVFSSEAEELEKCGANYTGKNVEIDGNIITASGPQAAKQFGEKILELLKKGAINGQN